MFQCQLLPSGHYHASNIVITIAQCRGDWLSVSLERWEEDTKGDPRQQLQSLWNETKCYPSIWYYLHAKYTQKLTVSFTATGWQCTACKRNTYNGSCALCWNGRMQGFHSITKTRFKDFQGHLRFPRTADLILVHYNGMEVTLRVCDMWAFRSTDSIWLSLSQTDWYNSITLSQYQLWS